MASYDLAIVGGGIGGSALATVMARAGYSVLLLEQSEVYEDRVRGEWIAPWGVAEIKRVGLYDLLMEAGGHHVARHVTYDESRDAGGAPRRGRCRSSIFAPGVPGPLCIGHPHALPDPVRRRRRAAGADARRGVQVTEVAARRAAARDLRARRRDLDGRRRGWWSAPTGAPRRCARRPASALHQDKPHHWFAGLLVEGAEGWDHGPAGHRHRGRFRLPGLPAGRRARCGSTAAMRSTRRKRFAGRGAPRRVPRRLRA